MITCRRNPGGAGSGTIQCAGAEWAWSLAAVVRASCAACCCHFVPFVAVCVSGSVAAGSSSTDAQLVVRWPITRPIVSYLEREASSCAVASQVASPPTGGPVPLDVRPI